MAPQSRTALRRGAVQPAPRPAAPQRGITREEAHALRGLADDGDGEPAPGDPTPSRPD